ncbi:MAG: hypothetical protein Q4B09_05435 [Lachnospiraceae bacterium]|nr:hypothetical protein [Lachnospiraceae bacterium]
MSPFSQTVITALISSGLCGALFSFITFLITRHDRKMEKKEQRNSATNKMLIGLGHDRLLALGAIYIRRGAITVSEKSNLKMIYEPYHGLGGNSDGTTIYEECMKLSVISEEEAKKLDAENRRKEWER